MDMEKIMAYVEKIAENLEGLVCAIGCDSMPSDQSYHGGQDWTVGRVSGISGTVSEGEGSREKTGKAVCERKNKTGETNSTGKEKSEYGKVKK